MIGIINHLKLELHPAVIPMFLVGGVAFKVWKLFLRLKWSLELTHQLTDLNNVIRDNIAVAKNQFQINQARLEAEQAQRNAQLEAELENQRLQWVEFTQRAEALGQAIKKFRRQCRISQQLKFLKSRQAKLDAEAAIREKRRERAFRLAQAAEARQAKERKEREEIEAAQEQFRLSQAEIKRRKKIEKQAENDAKHAAAVLAKNSEVKIPVQPELKQVQIVQVSKTTNQVIPVNMAPVLVSDEPAEKPVPGGFICYKSRIWQDLFQNVNNNIPGAIKYYSDAGLAVSFNTSEFEIFYGPIQKMALTRYAPLRGVTVDWFNRAARTISKKPKTPLSGVTGLIGAVAVWPTGKDDKTGWTFSKFNIRTFKSGVFSVSIREDKKEMRLGYYDPRKWIGEPLLLVFDFAFAPQSVSWQKVEPVAIDPLLLQVSSVKDTFKPFVPGAHVIDFLEGRSTEDPFFSGRQIEVPEQEAFLLCEVCSEIVDTLIVYEHMEICEACMAARLEKQTIEPEDSDDDDAILERLMKQAKSQKLQKSALGPSGTEKSRFNPKLTTVSIAHWEPITDNSSDLEEEPFEKGW